MNISLTSLSLETLPRLLELSRDLHTQDALDYDPERAQNTFMLLQNHSAYGDIYLIQSKEQNSTNIIGFVVLCYSFSIELGGHVATLDQFYLSPEWRRQKVGSHVLPLLEQRAKNKACQIIKLEVNIGNGGARQFYERFDYMPHRQHYIMSKEIN